MKYISQHEDSVYFKKRSALRVICSNCGHTTYDMVGDREICQWCNHWIYKNKRIEFKYKVKEAMLNGKTKTN